MEEFVKGCELCQSLDKYNCFRPGPLIPISLPDRPWLKLGMDIVRPFDNLQRQFRFAITLIDYYSKWPEVVLTDNVKTEKIIQFLSLVFEREGICEELVTYNGPQFTSYIFKEFLSGLGMKPSDTSRVMKVRPYDGNKIVELRWSERAKQKPKWMHDYVTK